MTRKYTVLYETGPNSVGAHVRELPGCIAVGETREEAEKLIQEAITMHLEAMQHAPQMFPKLPLTGIATNGKPALRQCRQEPWINAARPLGRAGHTGFVETTPCASPEKAAGPDALGDGLSESPGQLAKNGSIAKVSGNHPKMASSQDAQNTIV